MEGFKIDNVHPDSAISLEETTFRVHELKKIVLDSLESIASSFNHCIYRKRTEIQFDSKVWIDGGAKCQILQPHESNGWKSGRLKLSVCLEFVADDDPLGDNLAEGIVISSSSLDEIRAGTSELASE